MEKTVHSLYALQELELVLAETRILHQQAPEAPDTAAFEAKLDQARKRVPKEQLRRYELLRRNHQLAVVREKAGSCTGCNLNVPQGDLNRMRRGEMDWVCPNCARFILLATD